MPLSTVQADVLRSSPPNRSPDSYAGSVVGGRSACWCATGDQSAARGPRSRPTAARNFGQPVTYRITTSSL